VFLFFSAKRSHGSKIWIISVSFFFFLVLLECLVTVVAQVDRSSNTQKGESGTKERQEVLPMFFSFSFFLVCLGGHVEVGFSGFSFLE
jgi:hypothetical protein